MSVPEKDEANAFDFQTDTFEDYVDGIIHEWLKTLTILGFTLVPLFMILDFFTMPAELLPRFGLYRLFSTVLLVAQHILIRRSRPSRFSYLHAFFSSIVVGGIIALMTVDLGGFNSRYYAGLNLVIIGVNLLMPWKAVYSAINSLILIGLYFYLNLMATHAYEVSVLVNNLFFLLATAVITVSINHVKHKLVEKEFYLLQALQYARDALWSEMELAKRIQTALLPNNPSLQGYEIAAAMYPAKEVGGDYYDIIDTRENGRWITIGDVSGHGVDSGLIMMMAETSIRSTIHSMVDTNPAMVIDAVNEVIRENINRLGSDHYMSLMAIRLDDSGMSVAGKHQDIIVHRSSSNKTESIPTQGTWIGIANRIFKYLPIKKIKIQQGDIVLLFTDGITEAANERGEMFDQRRLEQALNKYADLPVGKLVEKIIKDVEEYQVEQNDDMTLIALRKATS